MATKKAREQRLIKRYAGSRLYDPSSGSYVSVEDLKRWHIDGYEVVVRDAETGQFVTQDVLAADSVH
jgi:polyhydroxyalkanoate synthesis regulator protein